MSDPSSGGIPTVSIEIDGKPLKVAQGTMIIEAADAANITIPRFCYHKKLQIAANCRMCLVDAENSRKPIPACATPVTDGMKIFTKSPKALQYQKAVMEFLLINHPLDCPICDQGGECELQDLSMGYGKDVSRYNQGKRVIEDKDLGPLVATDLTRCIHCTRCVRFGTEIAGERDLGMLGRGEHSEIENFLSQPMQSEMSGNVIDLCPVGALTSKPFRFKARSWELQQKSALGLHDAVGSHLYAHVRRGQVMRAVPRECEELNEVWLSDRDRFSYEGLTHAARVQKPKIKRNGVWEELAWTEVLPVIADNLKPLIAAHGPDLVGGLISPNASVEELFLFQKFLRSLGVNTIDHRLRQTDFSVTQSPTQMLLDLSLQEMMASDLIFLVGSNVRHEIPIVHHRIRQASLEGASVWTLNPERFDLRFDNLTQQLVNLDEMALEVAGVLKAVLELRPSGTLSHSIPQVAEGLSQLLSDINVSDHNRQLAQALIGAKSPVILSGGLVNSHPQSGLLWNLLQTLRAHLAAKGGHLTEGANSAGAYWAGALPGRGPGGSILPEGAHAGEILSGTKSLKALLLLGLDPVLDSAYGIHAAEALSQVEHVIALTAFITPALENLATVILPIAAGFENEGTWINLLGQWQSMEASVPPLGESKPAWKVLRVLGNGCDLPNFEYQTHSEIIDELKQILGEQSPEAPQIIWPSALPKADMEMRRLAEVPIYAGDMIVRHAKSLQATPHMQGLGVKISQALADRLGIQSGELVAVEQAGKAPVHLSVQITADIADRTVSIPMGIELTAGLGRAGDLVKLGRA